MDRYRSDSDLRRPANCFWRRSPWGITKASASGSASSAAFKAYCALEYEIRAASRIPIALGCGEVFERRIAQNDRRTLQLPCQGALGKQVAVLHFPAVLGGVVGQYQG